MHFAAARESGQKKRFRPKDPFVDAKKRPSKVRKKRHGAGDVGKLTKAEQLAATAKARLLAAEASRAARAAKTALDAAAAVKTADAAAAARAHLAVDAAARKHGDAAAAAFVKAEAVAAAGAKHAASVANGASSTGPGLNSSPRGAMGPATSTSICTLTRQSALTRIHALWLREPAPLLPSSTLLSVVTLSGSALSDAARAGTSVRVVIPRELLKKAFSVLASERSAAGRRSAESADRTEQAVQLQLDDCAPVVAFSTTLDQMGAVLASNEAIESSRRLLSWLGGLAASKTLMPTKLNFSSDESVRVCSMAGAVRDNIGARLPGDCVWARRGVRRMSSAFLAEAFDGCSVTVQDMCDAGQPAFITNALLDAGLAELQLRCAGASVPTGVLSCSQSASFTSIAGVEVDMPRALQSIVEVLGTWGPSVQQFVMMVNIGNNHWVSASVSMLSRSVTLFDSLGGPSVLKSLVVSRLLLFARQAELRRRVVLPGLSEGEIDWIVDDEVNEPSQRDSYNCGLFAFAHVWFSVHGYDFASISVSCDELRLSLMQFVLKSGEDQPAGQRQTPRRP